MPKKEWAQKLATLLPGKTRTMFQTVTEEYTADYDAMKETLLAAFGLTTAECQRNYLFLCQGATETMSELSVRVKCIHTYMGN